MNDTKFFIIVQLLLFNAVVSTDSLILATVILIAQLLVFIIQGIITFRD